MSDPVYEYVKGEGWVLTPEAKEWVVLFRCHLHNWRNHQRVGFTYKSHQEAVNIKNELTYHYRVRYGWSDWEFQVLNADLQLEGVSVRCI